MKEVEHHADRRTVSTCMSSQVIPHPHALPPENNHTPDVVFQSIDRAQRIVAFGNDFIMEDVGVIV